MISLTVFSARCNIHLALMLRCQRPSVCPSVCDGRKCIGALFRFQIPIEIYRALWSQPTMCPHALRVAMNAGTLWSRCMLGREEGSTRAMLAIARPFC